MSRYSPPKIWTLYQAQITTEEVAQHPASTPSSGTADTQKNSSGNTLKTRRSISWKFRILYQEHMINEQVARQLLATKQFSGYIGCSKEIQAAISLKPEGVSRLNFEFYIRSTCQSRRWHDKSSTQSVLLIHRLFEGNSSGSISKARRCISLKFRILYQEHMTIQEVVRQILASNSSPDT